MLGTFWAHAGIDKNGAYFFAFLALPIVDWKADESSFCPWHSASQESDDRAKMSDFVLQLLQGRSIYPFDPFTLFRKRLLKKKLSFPSNSTRKWDKFASQAQLTITAVFQTFILKISSCKIELQVATQRLAKSLTFGCFVYGQARELPPWLLELDGILYFKLEFLLGATLHPPDLWSL